MKELAKKRILITANHFYPCRGGLENFVLDLAMRLSDNYEVDVLVVNYDKSKSNEKIGNVNILRTPGWEVLKERFTAPNIFSARFWKETKERIRTKYDVVINNTRFFPITAVGWFIAKRSKRNGTKLIHIEHGNRHVIHSNFFVTAVSWVYDQTIGRIVITGANQTIGISSPCVNFSRKMGAKNPVLMYNSIDTNIFTKKKTNLRKKFEISDNEKVIINGIGRIIYAKGLHDTVNAVRDMADITVIVPGDGPYVSKIKEIAKKNKVKVLFPGVLSQKEVVKYLSIADLFVNPSYSEGLPTCVLEAGAMGVPCIATDVGGTREIINKPENGYLVKPNNVKNLRKAILAILKRNENDRKKIGLNLQKRIKEEFDWDKNIKKIKSIIENLR